MTSVWTLELGHTHKIVLLALADNANDEGVCYPSIATIIKKCGLSERCAQKVITDLELSGALHRELRDGRSTLYHITPAEYAPRTTRTPAPRAPTPAPDAPPPPQSVRDTPAPRAPITSKKPSIEPSRNLKNSACLEFEELKRVYPKRGGDQGWAEALRRCSAHLKRGTGWSEILEGAARYAHYCRETHNEGTQYVKSAAVFCGPDKHFEKPWNPPLTKGEVVREQNIDASLQWLEQQERQDEIRRQS